MKKYTTLLLVIALMATGCTEDELATHEFTKQQIAAKNLAGDWGAAYNIEAPDVESADALRNLTMLFTVDENGNPDKFLSDGSLSTFGNKTGNWAWADGNSTSDVVLSEVGPITTFSISYSDNIDTITILFNAVNATGRVASVGNYEVSFQRL